ncbi:hypothetical protein AM500_04170 [Bacillus sp. FJAT-18017]|nr:hypothetical protein AM500_04170 [Bacillus sp. FJAT-18017]
MRGWENLSFSVLVTGNQKEICNGLFLLNLLGGSHLDKKMPESRILSWAESGDSGSSILIIKLPK